MEQERSHTDYNLDKFINRKSNILFITGYSASGKSTIAEKYANKYKALYIELDIIHSNYLAKACEPTRMGYSSEEGITALKEFWVPFTLHYKLGSVITLDNHKFLTLNARYHSMSTPERCKLVIDYAISISSKHRCIIEGVQLYLYKELWSTIMNYPTIIMDTSAFKSRISHGKRAKKLEISKFSHLNKYYDRQVLLLRQFKEELDRRNNMYDKIMESYIIDDYSSEGLFFNKRPKTIGHGFGDEKDAYAINFYKTGEKAGINIPSKRWAHMFVERATGYNTYASSGMIRYGQEIITKYVNELIKLSDFVDQNAARYEEAFETRNEEELDAIIVQFKNKAGYLIATNRNCATTFTGPQELIPDGWGRKLIPTLTKYQQLYEKVGEYVGSKIYFYKYKNGRANQKIVTNNLQRHYLYLELLDYCGDLWEILSQYLDTAK
jgi:deoxyadenosine/deoxycytidine kinase